MAPEQTFVQKELSQIVYRSRSSLYEDIDVEKLKPKNNFMCDGNGKAIAKEKMRGSTR
jgi:hypothetical protein